MLIIEITGNPKKWNLTHLILDKKIYLNRLLTRYFYLSHLLLMYTNHKRKLIMSKQFLLMPKFECIRRAFPTSLILDKNLFCRLLTQYFCSSHLLLMYTNHKRKRIMSKLFLLMSKFYCIRGLYPVQVLSTKNSGISIW